jgi:hypothetical protein
MHDTLGMRTTMSVRDRSAELVCIQWEATQQGRRVGYKASCCNDLELGLPLLIGRRVRTEQISCSDFQSTVSPPTLLEARSSFK